ncbi:MFS transporter [Serinicoccus chungangensis]|uniref:MFS transporter n=1 Tax=Serinicoccus chungangensis TaxID=767452 RepID=A0A0W8I1C0_9MICO|nr:MFS transporter [Serinicoccus chungangensis]KUG51525.1 MFS transporter [Serinicoccus chungangensis]
MSRRGGTRAADQDFRLRDVALPAFAPTVVNAVGLGAITPVLALLARDLGASVGEAAFVVALLGVGSLLGALPAGALVARIGERRAMVLAGVADALALGVVALAPSLAVLGVGVVASGMTWAVFLLARQGFLIVVAPVHQRARAMSTLGGSHRIGGFLGPVLGGVLLAATGELRSVFWLAAAMALLSALVVQLAPDLTAGHERADRAGGARPTRVLSVLRHHWRTLASVGSAVVVISGARSLRMVLLPLWADHVGISAATTSLVFGAAALLEICLFYPAGWAMDRAGRTVVAVPVVALIGLGVVLLPLAGAVTGFTLLALLMAVGNGLGSGIVMTLGADTAPEQGRAQYLGGYRLAGDVGGLGGPLLVSGLSLVAPLAAVCVVVGSLCLLGTGWVAHRVGRIDRRRRVGVAQSAG